MTSMRVRYDRKYTPPLVEGMPPWTSALRPARRHSESGEDTIADAIKSVQSRQGKDVARTGGAG